MDIKQSASTIHGILYNLATIMASTLRLEDLGHRLLSELLSAMRISHGAIVLLTKDSKIYQVLHEGYASVPEFDEKEIAILSDQVKILVFNELPEGKLKDILKKLDVAVVVCLRTQEENIGLLLLGRKLLGGLYTPYEIQALKILAPETAVAIQNARSFEEIQRFNATLEQKVSDATEDLRNVNEEVYKKNVELARLSKELSQANDKLKTLDKLKDEFLSLASHELRTPMVAIKSYIWMVLQGRGGNVTEKQKDYLNIAYRSTNSLIALVNDMLNISRIESGKITLDLKRLRLNDLVKEVVTEMTPRAKEFQIEIMETFSPALSEIWGDSSKIKEVLMNLIGNSLKFTPRGGKVTVSLNQKDNFIETCVSDNGIGIKKEDMSKLFQKFSMVGITKQKEKNIQGTGLGLYLCKLIVELHGGRIWVESEGEDKGSAFTFSVKVASPLS
ncbi:MAG: PAS/PAC sensor signal transduction histidine kinase [uncultured bacterium]|nr:MAG: PAS/PAC sensor signal transduction histidine kinase [uncultured bacterium]